MFKCFARYLSVPQRHDVMLAHKDHPYVARYAAAIRSSSLIIANVTLDIVERVLKRAYERPLGLLVLTTTVQEASIYVQLHYLPRYRRSTRMLVVVTGAALASSHNDWQTIFGVANVFYVRNVAVLRTATAGNDAHVYTHFPYGSGACGRRHTPVSLGPCQRLPHLDQLYPEKEPGRFNRCPVRLSVNAPPPAIIDAASTSDRPLVAGVEIALANIILGRLHLNATRIANSESCELAYAYYRDRLRWYVPLAGPRVQWQGLLLLFSVPLWLAVLASFLLNTLVECVLGSLLTLLNGAVPLPRRSYRRFVVVAWTLCTLVLIAGYQSQLLSTLLTPVPGPQPISNLRELLASDTPVVYGFQKLFGCCGTSISAGGRGAGPRTSRSRLAI